MKCIYCDAKAAPLYHTEAQGTHITCLECANYGLGTPESDTAPDEIDRQVPAT